MIIANVPFATIGGIFALFVSGQYVSVPSAIGFIAVFGVAMLNGIMLVSFINELRGKGLGDATTAGRGCHRWADHLDFADVDPAAGHIRVG